MTCIIQTAAWSNGNRPVLTKTITPTKVEAFGLIKHYDMTNVTIGSFDDMVDVVSTIEGVPTFALTRGRAINEGARQQRLLRDQPDGKKATIEAVSEGLQWLMLDVDKLPIPAGLPATNEARVAYMRSTLPAPFRDASCYFQWSSRAGLVEEPGLVRQGWEVLSAHLFFWLDRPHLCSSLHKRSSDKEGDWKHIVDPAPFTANQIHYTAAPIFLNFADPLAEIGRSGVIRGTHDTVALNSWTPPYRPRPVYSARRMEDLNPGEKFGELLREIGPVHYHLPILSAIAHYTAVTEPLKRDKIECLNAVRMQAADAPRDYINDHYLSRLYDDGVAKFGRSLSPRDDW